jgi:uncharacterized protein YbjT (DUF2867 family)
MIIALASPGIASNLDDGLDKIKWLMSEASAQGAEIAGIVGRWRAIRLLNRLEPTAMKVLVTGGTGNLGRALTRAVTATRHTVRIMSRRDRPQLATNNFEWAQADIALGEGVREAVAGVDAILHAASDPRRARAVDVNGTRHLVEAAQASGIAHLIYVSIVGIDDIPYSYYKRKREAEEIIKSSGVPYSVLRATQFHSLVDSLVSVAARVPVVMPLPTDFKFQSVAESEVAERLVRQLIERPGGRLPDLGGAEVLTLGEMAEIWMSVKGARKKLVHLPLPGAIAAGFRAGKNTAPEGVRGVTRWREWLIQRTQPKHEWDKRTEKLETAMRILKLFYGIASVISLVNGAWMLIFPFSWYTDFPAAIPDTGSFNAHFIRDLGVVFILAALGFGWCALHPHRCRLTHGVLTIFFVGHALIHLADILTGRVPHTHWLIDAPAVFVPAILLTILAISPIRKYLGESSWWNAVLHPKQVIRADNSIACFSCSFFEISLELLARRCSIPGVQWLFRYFQTVAIYERQTATCRLGARRH